MLYSKHQFTYVGVSDCIKTFLYKVSEVSKETLFVTSRFVPQLVELLLEALPGQHDVQLNFTVVPLKTWPFVS